jgi:hypothetical protein
VVGFLLQRVPLNQAPTVTRFTQFFPDVLPAYMALSAISSNASFDAVSSGQQA